MTQFTFRPDTEILAESEAVYEPAEKHDIIETHQLACNRPIVLGRSDDYRTICERAASHFTYMFTENEYEY